MANKTFLVLFIWIYNQGIMYLKCLYNYETVHCTVQCTLVHVYVHIKRVKFPCCSGGKSVNNCINVRGVRSVDL